MKAVRAEEFSLKRLCKFSMDECGRLSTTLKESNEEKRRNVLHADLFEKCNQDNKRPIQRRVFFTPFLYSFWKYACVMTVHSSLLYLCPETSLPSTRAKLLFLWSFFLIIREVSVQSFFSDDFCHDPTIHLQV